MGEGRVSIVRRLTSVVAAAALWGCSSPTVVEDQSEALPPPTFSGPTPIDGIQTAVFAGGCFWSVEAVFEHVKGVREVVTGYSGGTEATAQYHLVVNHQTDHAEVVRIFFDSNEVSYADLIRVFFSVVHDPTQVDRQGPDIGAAYRSHIYTFSQTQHDIAAAYVDQLEASGIFSDPIATRLDPYFSFFLAEEEHQDYVEKNPEEPYVVLYSLPKLAKLEAFLPELYVP